MKRKITIIDYGLSNLLSVYHAFSLFADECVIVNDAKSIDIAEAIVLPGVGAFSDGMEGLEKLGLVDSILRSVKKEVPLLGICLGMQMLFEESDEFGVHKGLGLIPGRVERIPSIDVNGYIQKIPHISWNPLYTTDGNNDFGDSILKYIRPQEECYFIHSFEAKPTSFNNRLADTEYGGRRVCAVVQNGNVFGTQFHPEKSGKVGLNIIRAFCEL